MTTATLKPVTRRQATEVRSPGRRRSLGRNLWWFVVPALVCYLYVVVIPAVQGIYMSFTDWSAYSRTRHLVGWENYRGLFDGLSGDALVRTVVVAAVTMAVQNVVGLLLALALNARVFGRNVLRTVIFAPVIVSPLVCGYLFKYIFAPPGIGAANDFLEAVGLEQLRQDWLGQPGTALAVVIVVICWQFVGVSMVVYLAGLQSVPAELLEAAALDGAGAGRRFWYVVRPLLAPAVTINLMLSLIGGLKIFDQIYATTQGGPAGQTETISTLIYKQFSQFGAYGESAALAVALAVGVAILSLIQFMVLRRQERKS
ncbi:sugar ABC transporter permease [Amycolatopsis balhimycina DSM 5908]|uniref:Sugar ABC transporter permease n=1 Tax=Amycolatopsis balhimycina DSM 5908 TaxID=1081091 RepID=A0A428WJA8_AMYBA|nr:sugar ABC transporter permease [Amycolatopsis balhimycina]RSM43168.1 sugar ABC transporter permease [Amycolatopsis balhimycina DSM 5908]